MAGIWWLASYPKSGNTWVRALLTSLISGQPVDINDMSALGSGIASSRALIDDLLGIESGELTEKQQAEVRPRAYEVMAAEAEDPLYLKVHDGYGPTPAGEPIFPPSATAGAVYIVRNPLDVAVSLAHYNRISMPQAVDDLLTSKASLADKERPSGRQFAQRLGDWEAHVNGWLGAPFPVHLVRYEDLLADTEGAFGRVVRFLNRHEGPEEIRRAVRDSAFEKLSSQEAQHGFRANSRSGNRFFRRGIAGAWQEELPEEQVQRITNAFGPVMAKFGY